MTKAGECPMASNEPCQNLCYGECALRDALDRLNRRGYLDANPCAGDEGNTDLKFARDALAAAPKHEQQEAPELTDDEIEASVRSDRRPGTFFDRIDFARAVIAADRAKRAKPTDDPAAAWRTEGFNQWRQARASRTTED